MLSSVFDAEVERAKSKVDNDVDVTSLVDVLLLVEYVVLVTVELEVGEKVVVVLVVGASVERNAVGPTVVSASTG